MDGGGTETADDLLDPIMSRTKAQLEKDKIKLAKAMHGEGIPKRDEITAGKWQFVSLSKMAEFAEITKVIDLHQDGRCSGEFRIAKSGYATNLKVSGSWRYDGKKRLLGLDVQTALEGIGLPEWDNMSELVENMPLPAKFTKATADREEYAVLEGSEGDYLARDSNGQQWRLKRLG